MNDQEAEEVACRTPKRQRNRELKGAKRAYRLREGFSKVDV